MVFINPSWPTVTTAISATIAVRQVPVRLVSASVNPLAYILYSAKAIIVPHTSINTKLVHWSLMGELLHFVQREGDSKEGPQPARPLLAVPNVTAHPLTASVQIIVLLYNGRLLCDCAH